MIQEKSLVKRSLFYIGIALLVAGVLCGVFYGIWHLMAGGSLLIPRILDIQKKANKKKERIDDAYQQEKEDLDRREQQAKKEEKAAYEKDVKDAKTITEKAKEAEEIRRKILESFAKGD